MLKLHCLNTYPLLHQRTAKLPIQTLKYPFPLWIYGHYIFFFFTVWGSPLDVRFWRWKSSYFLHCISWKPYIQIFENFTVYILNLCTRKWHNYKIDIETTIFFCHKSILSEQSVVYVMHLSGPNDTLAARVDIWNARKVNVKPQRGLTLITMLNSLV